MIETLLALDISLFHLINSSWTNSVFDVVFPFITNLNRQPAILALVLAVMIWAVWRGGERGRRVVLMMVLTIIVTDQVNSFVLKDLFGRVRPCHVLAEVRLLVDCGSGLSFPSSHAVNNFAGALVIGFFYPRALWYLMGFATVVAYSRVYVGVHYPSDVLGGAIVGLMFAALLLWVAWLVERFVHSRRHRV